MSTFTELQAAHEKLLRRQQTGEDIQADVEAYIAKARVASSEIASPRERDQLRANLRYWASYVFEKKKSYPAADLLPSKTIFLGPGLNLTTVIVAIIGLLGMIVTAVISFGFIGSARPTATITAIVGIIITPTASATSNPPTPTITPTPPPPTPPPTDTPAPQLSPTVNQAGIVVQLTSPQEGQAASPQVALAGNYSNLQSGWSIHVLLQPLLRSGRYFPLPDFFIVPSSVTSGEWSLAATLGQGAELERPEQYNLRLVVAIDEQGRKALKDAEKSGFEQLPGGLIPFPQVVTVSRGAYRAIGEVRLLYSSIVETGYELFVARPNDGSDVHQLTYTRSIGERDASLSPSGQQMAFVGEEVDRASGNLTHAVWLADSDGQNRVLLDREPGADYDRPLWSPDGRYIAYSANAHEEAGRGFSLFLYEIATSESRHIETGLRSSRFPSWTPDSKALVYSAYSASGSTQDLFQIDIASGQVTPLLETNSSEETQPVVSPDGTKVAYLGSPNEARTSNRDIFVLDLNTHKSKQLTTGIGLDWFPAWSPDSQTIYFESWRATGPYIWSIDADGNNKLQITRGRTTIRPFVGRMVAFLPLSP